MKSFYYFTEPIFQCYDTDEEVEMVDDVKDPVGLPSKIIFQATTTQSMGICASVKSVEQSFSRVTKKRMPMRRSGGKKT